MFCMIRHELSEPANEERGVSLPVTLTIHQQKCCVDDSIAQPIISLNGVLVKIKPNRLGLLSFIKCGKPTALFVPSSQPPYFSRPSHRTIDHCIDSTISLVPNLNPADEGQGAVRNNSVSTLTSTSTVTARSSCSSWEIRCAKSVKRSGQRKRARSREAASSEWPTCLVRRVNWAAAQEIAVPNSGHEMQSTGTRSSITHVRIQRPQLAIVPTDFQITSQTRRPREDGRGGTSREWVWYSTQVTSLPSGCPTEEYHGRTRTCHSEPQPPRDRDPGAWLVPGPARPQHRSNSSMKPTSVLLLLSTYSFPSCLTTNSNCVTKDPKPTSQTLFDTYLATPVNIKRLAVHDALNIILPHKPPTTMRSGP